MTKVCAFVLCGKEFTADKYNGARRKFCSARCKAYYYNVANGNTTLDTARSAYNGSPHIELICRMCLSAFFVSSLIGNPKYCSEKCSNRAGQLSIKYKLNPEQYRALIQAQRGLCAICQQPNELFVDHNHVTGRVRGLLCNACNVSMAMFDAHKERVMEYLNGDDTDPAERS